MTESVTIFSALIAGIISFVSPCVLPLVPVYLSTMTGLTAEDLENQSNRPVFHIFISSVAFCLGFSVVFILLGLTATTIGNFLISHIRILEVIAGVIIVIFGLHMTGLLKIGFLYRTLQLGNKGGQPKELTKHTGIHVFLKPFGMGFFFAFGWTPCVGPILAAVLAMAATEETVLRGGGLLAVYSLGLSVPFIIAGVAFSSFTTHYKNFRKHLHAVEVISGVLLILFGLLIATHNFTLLASWFAKFLPEPTL